MLQSTGISTISGIKMSNAQRGGWNGGGRGEGVGWRHFFQQIHWKIYPIINLIRLVGFNGTGHFDLIDDVIISIVLFMLLIRLWSIHMEMN